MNEQEINKSVIQTITPDQTKSDSLKISGTQKLKHVLPDLRLAPSRPSGPDEVFVA